MATFILPSKLVAERVTVWFPFQAELNILEEVVTWSVEIETLVGIDPGPELLLYGVAALDGQEVSQQVEAGIPGVIYQLRCTIVTDLGQTIQHLAKLAILPSPEIVPDLILRYYTTELYPLETQEFYQNGMDFVTGRLRPQPFIFEYFTNGFVFASGTLETKLITYEMDPDAYTHGMAFQTGTLVSKLIEYEGPPEEFTHGINFINGTLESKLITYTTVPEKFTHSMSFVSGTLV